MDLNLIKKPVITEKSTTNAQFNKYILKLEKMQISFQLKKLLKIRIKSKLRS